MSIKLHIEQKPNRIYCKCGICLKDIKVGEERWVITSLGYKSSSKMYFHPECFRKAINEMTDKGEGEIES